MTDEHPCSPNRGRKLNWRQACVLIGCGKTQFYALVESGRLPAYRPEGCKRGLWVYEADVTACIRQVENNLTEISL